MGKPDNKLLEMLLHILRGNNSYRSLARLGPKLRIAK
jgi:hypothetical protein